MCASVLGRRDAVEDEVLQISAQFPGCGWMQSRHVLPALRNPYADPLSLIQVELLRRKRGGQDNDNLNYALAATINGIAAGLRNTE